MPPHTKIVNRFHLTDLLSPGFKIPDLAQEEFLSDFTMFRGLPDSGIKFDEISE